MSFIDTTRTTSTKAKRAQRSRENSQRAKVLVTLVLLTVIGVAGFDFASVAITSAKLNDHAAKAGYAAVRVTNGKEIDRNVAEAAYAAAAATITDPNEFIARTGRSSSEAFSVAPDGAVTLTVVKQARTLVLGRISYFDDLTRVTETYTQAFLG